MEPTNSSIALVQKIGRSLRKFKGKGFSMILGCEEMLLDNSLLKTISKFDSRAKNKDMILISKKDLEYNLYDFDNKMKIIEIGASGEEYYKYKVECCIKISKDNGGNFPSKSKDENKKSLGNFIDSQKRRYKKLKGYGGKGAPLKEWEIKILNTYLPFKEWMKREDLNQKDKSK